MSSTHKTHYFLFPTYTYILETVGQIKTYLPCNQGVSVGILMCYCHLFTVMVANVTCCFSVVNSPKTEGSYERSVKSNTCFMSSGCKAPIPKLTSTLFGPWSTLSPQSMPRTHGASVLVAVETFCHSFPIRLTSASTTVSCHSRNAGGFCPL